MKNHKNLISYFRTLKAILILAFPVMLFSASCKGCSLYVGPVTTSVSMGDLIIQRDTPVGAVIKTQDVSINSNYMFPDNEQVCYLNTLLSYNDGIKSEQEHVYKTNLPGVGISVKIFSSWSDVYAENPSSVNMSWDYSAARNIQKATVNLVKIGDITSGVLNSGTLSTGFYGLTPNTTDGMLVYTLNLTATNITQLACSLKTPALAFDFGNIPASQFMAIGSTSQETVTKNIELDCDPGTNVNISINGKTDSSNPNVLSLTTGGNAATGLGVQILSGSQVLQMNTQIPLLTATSRSTMIPLSARYYQTASVITAGQANATATVQITYQ